MTSDVGHITHNYIYKQQSQKRAHDLLTAGIVEIHIGCDPPAKTHRPYTNSLWMCVSTTSFPFSPHFDGADNSNRSREKIPTQSICDVFAMWRMCAHIVKWENEDTDISFCVIFVLVLRSYYWLWGLRPILETCIIMGLGWFCVLCLFEVMRSHINT